ncbi:MAG TPA: hypothetical protein VF026_11170 [Ktedonobacteraceae bacterium]
MSILNSTRFLLQGLSEEEVCLHRAQGQGNKVKLPTSRSFAQLLRENIVTLINLILFAPSGVLLLLGRPLDAITTVAVISFNLLVGIPTVALAAWAHPGPAHANRLLLRLVHFVLRASLSASLKTLFVFLIAAALAVSTGASEAAVIATARSTITVFATVCGILLLVFVAPPSRFWAGRNAAGGDWRPAFLAAVLLG